MVFKAAWDSLAYRSPQKVAGAPLARYSIKVGNVHVLSLLRND
jgi:hypothetical protein